MNPPLIAVAALSRAAIILSAVVLLRGGMTTATKGGKADIEETVRTLLREHPEIVDEALRVIMEKRRRAEEERQRLNLKAKAKELNEDPGSVVGGNPAGDVFMVEFFDYNCPYCKRSHESVRNLVAEDGDIRFVYKEYPILGDNSVIAAQAALAARAQGKYIAFHNALMTHKGRLNKVTVIAVAEATGLDMARLKRDMTGPGIAAILSRTRALAKALEITGTPAYVIGDRLVPGAVDAASLKALIAEVREDKENF